MSTILPPFWISLSYFKPFTSKVFLRSNEAYKALLYLERSLIYLSTTYVKFIVLAHSVFLKNEGKRTCRNSDCLIAHANISTTQIRKAYGWFVPRVVDLLSTGRKSLVLAKASFSILFSGDRNKWLNDNSSISFFHAYIEPKHSQSKLHWKQGFGKYSRLSRSINIAISRSRVSTLKKQTNEVIRATNCCNLQCNIVALQVEKRCCTYYHPLQTLSRNKICCCENLLKKVDASSTWCNMLLQLATNKI